MEACVDLAVDPALHLGKVPKRRINRTLPVHRLREGVADRVSAQINIQVAEPYRDPVGQLVVRTASLPSNQSRNLALECGTMQL